MTWDNDPGGAVHLSLRNDRTGRIGMLGTPARDVVTACSKRGRFVWCQSPNRTLVLGYITCTSCLEWAAAHLDDFEEETTFEGERRHTWAG